MDTPTGGAAVESKPTAAVSENNTSAISEKLPTKRKVTLSWESIQALMDDAYLFQMPTKGTIGFEIEASNPLDDTEQQLVGEVQNFVIIVLGGQVIAGARRVALTPTKRKRMPTKPKQDAHQAGTKALDNMTRTVGDEK